MGEAGAASAATGLRAEREALRRAAAAPPVAAAAAGQAGVPGDQSVSRGWEHDRGLLVRPHWQLSRHCQ